MHGELKAPRKTSPTKRTHQNYSAHVRHHARPSPRTWTPWNGPSPSPWASPASSGWACPNAGRRGRPRALPGLAGHDVTQSKLFFGDEKKEESMSQLMSRCVHPFDIHVDRGPFGSLSLIPFPFRRRPGRSARKTREPGACPPPEPGQTPKMNQTCLQV